MEIKDLDELIEITDGDHPDWTVLQEDEEYVMCDVCEQRFLLKNNTDEKMYVLTFRQSYSDGVDDRFPIKIKKAVKVTEVTRYVYG